MAGRSPIAVRIQGQDYRISGDGDPGHAEQVQAAASLVDETMAKIRERTGTVDSVNLAVLAALNIARRHVALRDSVEAAPERIEPERIEALIELVESTAGPPARR